MAAMSAWRDTAKNDTCPDMISSWSVGMV
jgi:hypothetical protein